jgi:acyl-CoA synthetase (AMP-forming)/AMP-acid ligase II
MRPRQHSLQFFVDLFAVWSLGACAVCLNSSLTDDELHNVVTFAEPHAVLLGDRKMEPCPRVVQSVRDHRNRELGGWQLVTGTPA